MPWSAILNKPLNFTAVSSPIPRPFRRQFHSTHHCPYAEPLHPLLQTTLGTWPVHTSHRLTLLQPPPEGRRALRSEARVKKQGMSLGDRAALLVVGSSRRETCTPLIARAAKAQIPRYLRTVTRSVCDSASGGSRSKGRYLLLCVEVGQSARGERCRKETSSMS